MLPAFSARRRRLLVSHPLQEDRPPLEEVRGIQETPFFQSRHLGVAYPRVRTSLSSKELDWEPRCSDSSPNSNRVLGLVVRCSGPPRIKHNSREPSFLLALLSSDNYCSVFQFCI